MSEYFFEESEMNFRLITLVASGSKVYSYIYAADIEEAAGKAIRLYEYIERNSLGQNAVPISLVDLKTKEEFL